MMSIFSDYIENIIAVFMDDFSVYGNSFDNCLENLTLVLKRCIETNLACVKLGEMPFYGEAGDCLGPCYFGERN